jgi:hypothetical protein
MVEEFYSVGEGVCVDDWERGERVNSDRGG